MPTPRVDAARALVAELRDALDAADLPDVLASINPADVPSGSRNGIVLVQVPELVFVNFAFTEPTWELLIIAGPMGNPVAAWERIDQITAALEDANVNMATGAPATYEPLDPNAPALPAYSIKLNPI
jgi:hypothetical protein